jgi:hypothetical protein
MLRQRAASWVLKLVLDGPGKPREIADARLAQQGELQGHQGVVLDLSNRLVVFAGAQEDFVSQVGQEGQRVVTIRRQVGQSLELGTFSMGEGIHPGPSRKRLPVVPQEQLMVPTGQERLGLFGKFIRSAPSAPERMANCGGGVLRW